MASPNAPVKAGRTACYVPQSDRHGTLEITRTKGRKVAVYGYHVAELDHDLGPQFRCFSLVKYQSQQAPGEPAGYDVAVDTSGAGNHSCECLGFLRWQHCKHTAELADLVAAGDMPAPEAPSDPATWPAWTDEVAAAVAPCDPELTRALARILELASRPPADDQGAFALLDEVHHLATNACLYYLDRDRQDLDDDPPF